MESFFELNKHYSNWEEFNEEVKVYEATYDLSLVIEDSRLVVKGGVETFQYKVLRCTKSGDPQKSKSKGIRNKKYIMFE